VVLFTSGDIGAIHLDKVKVPTHKSPVQACIIILVVACNKKLGFPRIVLFTILHVLVIDSFLCINTL